MASIGTRENRRASPPNTSTLPQCGAVAVAVGVADAVVFVPDAAVVLVTIVVADLVLEVFVAFAVEELIGFAEEVLDAEPVEPLLPKQDAE